MGCPCCPIFLNARVRNFQKTGGTSSSASPTSWCWTGQGLPFYSGGVTFRRTVEVAPQHGDRVFVEIPAFRGTCVRVMVDGQEAGIVAWEPQEVDITDLAEGRDRIELALEVISHRRNAFGPLHNTETWPVWTGHGEFTSTGEQWQEEYNLGPTCIESW